MEKETKNFNHNNYESYARILGAFDKAKGESDFFESVLASFWRSIKDDFPESVTRRDLVSLLQYAVVIADYWEKVKIMCNCGLETIDRLHNENLEENSTGEENSNVL